MISGAPPDPRRRVLQGHKGVMTIVHLDLRHVVWTKLVSKFPPSFIPEIHAQAIEGMSEGERGLLLRLVSAVVRRKCRGRSRPPRELLLGGEYEQNP